MEDYQSTKKIGIATATIVGMNAMIGAGIFTAPAALTSGVGPGGILAYAFVIIAVWFMALSISRVASLYPEEGSFYNYAKQWGGHTMGVLSAGAYLIGLFIAMGLLSQVAGFYLHEYIHAVSPESLGILTLLALIILNMIGVKLSEAGQIVLICLTVIPLIITTIIGFMHADINNVIPFLPYGFKNVIAATKAVIFGFFGFEAAASLYAVVKNPEKNVPKALTYSIVIVGILYLLFVASIIVSVPITAFNKPEIAVTSILRHAFPEYKWLIPLLGISILSAILGTLHSMIWSSSSLLLSFFHQLKNPITKRIVHSKYNTQIAVLIVGSFILISTLIFKNLNLFFSLTAIFILFSYATSMITLLVKSTYATDKLITLAGLATASIIFIFAIQGVLQEIL